MATIVMEILSVKIKKIQFIKTQRKKTNQMIIDHRLKLEKQLN